MRPFIGCTGKAMIVCATRELCANLYEQMIKLRPAWESPDLDKGRLKIVYRGLPATSRRSASTFADRHRTRSFSSG